MSAHHWQQLCVPSLDVLQEVGIRCSKPNVGLISQQPIRKAAQVALCVCVRARSQYHEQAHLFGCLNEQFEARDIKLVGLGLVGAPLDDSEIMIELNYDSIRTVVNHHNHHLRLHGIESRGAHLRHSVQPLFRQNPKVGNGAGDISKRLSILAEAVCCVVDLVGSGISFR